jgi:hypothetical protein
MHRSLSHMRQTFVLGLAQNVAPAQHWDAPNPHVRQYGEALTCSTPVRGPSDHPDDAGRWSSSHARALHVHSELNVLNEFCPSLTFHSFEEILSWA